MLSELARRMNTAISQPATAETITMTTRREFVKTAALVPFAGLGASQNRITRRNRAQSENLPEEPVFAGKPLSYWLARVTSQNHDRDVCDVAEQWVFRHFGDVAVPGLIEALRNDVWFLAATELEMIGSPLAVRALTQALKADDSRVRHGAAAAMYGIALFKARQRPELVAVFRETFPILVEVLKTDREQQVATLSAWMLFEFAPWMAPDFSLPVAVSEYASAAVWATVVHRYPKHFPVDQVVPGLMTLLNNDDATTRLKAAEALSRFEPDEAAIVPVFVEHVIGREYISGLEFHGLDRFIEKALPTLRKKFQHGNTKVRVSILHALAWSRSSSVLPVLDEGLVDNAWEVRAEAASGLSMIESPMDSPQVLPLLIQALHDPERRVRKNARWVLESHEHLRVAALPGLLKLLERGNPIARTSAALALMDLGIETQRAMMALQPNLGHRDRCVRVEAAIAIAKIDPERSELVHLLAEGIESEEQDLRNGAIAVLGRMGENSAAVLPRLLAGLRQHFYAHGRLFEMLAKLGPVAAPALPYLVELMKDQELGRDVPEVLGRIGMPAIPSLTQALRSDDVLLQSRSMRALRYVDGATQGFVPLLAEILTSGRPVLKMVAAEALGHIGSPAASVVPTLIVASRDQDIGVRVYAQQAMKRIKGESTA